MTNMTNMKRVLNIYSVLVVILTFVFYYSKMIDFNLIKLILSTMCMGIIIFSGIIGLKTNTIIIGRGDLEYDNASVWGKIINYVLIFFGMIFIIIVLVIYIL